MVFYTTGFLRVKIHLNKMTLKKVEAFAYMAIAILVLVGAVLGFVIFYQESKEAERSVEEESQIENVEEDNSPYLYKSDQYNFSVIVPDGWKVVEGTIGNVPAINIFPENQTHNEMYDHFMNVTHISFYPMGIPTEGVFAQTRPLDLSLQVKTNDQSRSYMLGNGDIFARYILFENSPESWEEHGFVWARIAVQNQEEQCSSGGEFVPVDQCDVFFGDEIVVTGNVRAGHEDTLKSTFNSFEWN